MNIYFFLFAGLMFFLSGFVRAGEVDDNCVETGITTEMVCQAPFAGLLIRPSDFDGKTVAVVGVLSRGGHFLYGNKEGYEVGDLTNAVAVGSLPKIYNDDPLLFEEKYVVAVGIFSGTNVRNGTALIEAQYSMEIIDIGYLKRTVPNSAKKHGSKKGQE